MTTVLWLVLGALIGVAAAQRRGFSVVGGIIGGLLLGPMAVLMFAVSSSEQRKCPACAEWVKSAATVCKHCGRDLPPVEAPHRPATPPTRPPAPARSFTAGERQAGRRRARAAFAVAGVLLVGSVALGVWIGRLVSLGGDGVSAAELALAGRLQFIVAGTVTAGLVAAAYGTVTLAGQGRPK